MELLLYFFVICLMIVIGCSAYWIYCKAQDFCVWVCDWQDRRQLQRTLQQATHQAYSRRWR